MIEMNQYCMVKRFASDYSKVKRVQVKRDNGYRPSRS